MASDKGIKKLANGRWHVDIRPSGSDSNRVRKSFDTKGEAKRFKAMLIDSATQNNPWNPKQEKQDIRTLSDLVPLWWDVKGFELKEATKRRSRLEHTIKNLGNPIASEFSGADFIHYRKSRLEGGTSANTVNKEKVFLSSMFNELIHTGHWQESNPLTSVKPIKMQAPILTFLSEAEVKALLIESAESNNSNLQIIIKICLATGARWGEAENLRGEFVANGKLTFTDTKNGDNRTVPITSELEKEILQGRPRSGELFPGTHVHAFENAADRAKIQLPKGQNTHVLRHTFASHFVMLGGNILVLNKVLGHRTLQMTMRYAHLAPEYLSEAKKFNLISTETE